MGPDEFQYGPTLGRLGCYAHKARPTRVSVSSKELPVKPMGIQVVACIPAEAGITVRH